MGIGILIEKDILVEHITTQHEIYRMTTEEIIKYIKDTKELDRDSDGNCSDCKEWISENHKLRIRTKILEKRIKRKRRFQEYC